MSDPKVRRGRAWLAGPVLLLKVLLIAGVVTCSVGALGTVAFAVCPPCIGPVVVPESAPIPEPPPDPPEDPPPAKLGTPQ